MSENLSVRNDRNFRCAHSPCSDHPPSASGKFLVMEICENPTSRRSRARARSNINYSHGSKATGIVPRVVKRMEVFQASFLAAPRTGSRSRAFA